MSESRVSPQDQDTQPCEDYWTPIKVLAGVLMAVVALSVVAVVQWDEIERIALGASEDDRPGHRGLAYPAWDTEPAFDLENLLLDRDRILSGGPRKDGIPALTDPETVPVADADFMLDDDRVVGVTVNGESRAYPIKVLNRHECYNDELGGVPIAVIFCPLCDSVSVVDRQLGEQVYEFGISGLLYNSNVLLYDRVDDALWSQAGLIAVSGPNAGKSLTHLSGWEITTFADWRESHPDSTAATLETGHYGPERYNAVAYASYFQTDDVMFPVEATDPRFKNKYPVVGVWVDGKARAYPVDFIAEAPGGRVEESFGGGRVVLEPTEGGGVRVIEVPVGANVLHTFWFAWYAFHPETEVYGG